mgnify:FL=1
MLADGIEWFPVACPTVYGLARLRVRQEPRQIDARNGQRQGVDEAERVTIQALMGSQRDLQPRCKILAGPLLDGQANNGFQ